MERTNLLSTQQRMAQSARTGLHATVYEVQRDPKLKNKDVIRDKTKPVFPFVNGAKYKGQWLNDKKNGFGIQINPNDTKYEGEWSNDKYHGRGTLYVMNSKKKYSRLYVGDWAYGFMEGEGVYYFSDGSTYQGEWKDNKKCGKGTLTLTNGDLYNGEWMDDLKHGFGTLFYDNGNIYEGLWANGMKEGPGLFYYASTQKIYEGEWLEDQPRCGEYRKLNSEEQYRFVKPLPKGLYLNDFSIPELGIANPKGIIDIATSEVRLKSLEKNGGVSAAITKDNLEKANEIFSSYAADGLITLDYLGGVLYALGLKLSDFDVNEIINQLELKDTQDVSFTEAVEIAAYVSGSQEQF